MRRARQIALGGARFALLAGPAAMAFWSGGYFDSTRAVAGLIAWALVAVALLLGEPLPRRRSAQLALGGLGLFAAWTLLSILWAPIAGSAYHAGQRVFLYLGAMLAGATLLRTRSAVRAIEPALAAGVVFVVGYGLSERFLPGLLHFQRSISAFGRLEQPLTYWNAMGELAALGLVLCARVAGDCTRPGRMRVTAAVATAPLGMGLYLSVSRGALFACASGLVVLVVAAASREQARSVALTAASGILGALAAAPYGAVTTLVGSAADRQRQGATVLGLLAIIVIVVGICQRRINNRPSASQRMPKGAPWIALAMICTGLTVALVSGAKERSTGTLSQGSTRYTTLRSNRYAYWRVAARAIRDQPVRGVGAGGWAVYWLRLRPFNEFATDAHSLPLQTLAELGVIGLALLAAFLAGVGLAANEAMRRAPGLATGPLAGCIVYLVHSPLDWDWEMPAVTLIALMLAGALLVSAELQGTRDAVRP